MKDIESFQDSNLNELQFINNGQDILVTFLSSYDGRDIGRITFKEIVFFSYDDPYRELIDPIDEEVDRGFFTQYILDVETNKIEDFYEIQFNISNANIIIKCINYQVVRL